ncbi:MAG TPA: hypothetical protein DIW24_09245 [Bacteroidetes bacterium]|nr:hypothetical protein [Bacteroidota bacterium]
MHLSLTEDVLSGTYVYTSQNKPIILRGSLYEDQFSASEYDAAGRITGTFKGQLDEFENIQGLWRSADGRKQYPFSIERIGSRNRLDTTHSHQFVIKNAAPQYEARFSVANCEGDTCTGLATIGLYDKSGRHIQTFFSDDLYMTLDENQKPSVNVVQLYNEQSALVFDDFNFDGQTDLAIRNGNMSGYGGPSYDVYLYHPAKNRFEFHIPLSLMVMENLGLFRTDVKRKVLVTFTKSGCCWHQTSENAWRNGQIVLIKKITEDATGANDRVLVTTEVLTGTKWKKSVKTYKIADYYKE